MKTAAVILLVFATLALASAKNVTLSTEKISIYFKDADSTDFYIHKPKSDYKSGFRVVNQMIYDARNISVQFKDVNFKGVGAMDRNVTSVDGGIVPTISTLQAGKAVGASMTIVGAVWPEWAPVEYGKTAFEANPKPDPKLADMHIRPDSYKWGLKLTDWPTPSKKGNTTAALNITYSFIVLPPVTPSPSPAPPSPAPASPVPSPAVNGSSPSPAVNGSSPSPSPAPSSNSSSPSPKPAVSPAASPAASPSAPNATLLESHHNRRLLGFQVFTLNNGARTLGANGTNDTSPSPMPNNGTSPSPVINATSPSPSRLPPIPSPTPFPPITPEESASIADLDINLAEIALVDGKEVAVEVIKEGVVVVGSQEPGLRFRVLIPYGKEVIYDPVLRFQTPTVDVYRVTLLAKGQASTFPSKQFLQYLALALELPQEGEPLDVQSYNIMEVKNALKLVSTFNSKQAGLVDVQVDILSIPGQSADESVERLNYLIASGQTVLDKYGLGVLVGVTSEVAESPSPSPSGPGDKGGLKTWQWAAIGGGAALVVALFIGVICCRGKKDAKEEFHRIP